jgi:hypothetical protein
MIERGMKISVDWKEDTLYLEEKLDILEKNFDSLKRPQVVVPTYYEKPFHAYDQGNLCWQAAFEVTYDFPS